VGELWVGHSGGLLYHRWPDGTVDSLPSGVTALPGNGPDAIINALLLRGGRLLVASQVGALTSIPVP
jgi:ligand-binding sensor domain-containing protein